MCKYSIPLFFFHKLDFVAKEITSTVPKVTKLLKQTHSFQISIPPRKTLRQALSAAGLSPEASIRSSWQDKDERVWESEAATNAERIKNEFKFSYNTVLHVSVPEGMNFCRTILMGFVTALTIDGRWTKFERTVINFICFHTLFNFRQTTEISHFPSLIEIHAKQRERERAKHPSNDKWVFNPFNYRFRSLFNGTEENCKGARIIALSGEHAPEQVIACRSCLFVVFQRAAVGCGEEKDVAPLPSNGLLLRSVMARWLWLGNWRGNHRQEDHYDGFCGARGFPCKCKYAGRIVGVMKIGANLKWNW